MWAASKSDRYMNEAQRVAQLFGTERIIESKLNGISSQCEEDESLPQEKCGREKYAKWITNLCPTGSTNPINGVELNTIKQFRWGHEEEDDWQQCSQLIAPLHHVLHSVLQFRNSNEQFLRNYLLMAVRLKAKVLWNSDYDYSEQRAKLCKFT